MVKLLKLCLRPAVSSVGICDNMPIEILPSFLDELFKNFKDLPRPVQILLNFMFYAIPLGILIYYLDDTYGLI